MRCYFGAERVCVSVPSTLFAPPYSDRRVSPVHCVLRRARGTRGRTVQMYLYHAELTLTVLCKGLAPDGGGGGEAGNGM